MTLQYRADTGALLYVPSGALANECCCESPVYAPICLDTEVRIQGTVNGVAIDGAAVYDGHSGNRYVWIYRPTYSLRVDLFQYEETEQPFTRMLIEVSGILYDSGSVNYFEWPESCSGTLVVTVYRQGGGDSAVVTLTFGV